VNTSFVMSVVLGSIFDDNNVTFESDIPTSWVTLVQSQVQIDVGKTAKDVSGFNNVITFVPRLIGIPPPGWHAQNYFATSISEWEKGETITITGPFDAEEGAFLSLTGSVMDQIAIFRKESDN